MQGGNSLLRLIRRFGPKTLASSASGLETGFLECEERESGTERSTGSAFALSNPDSWFAARWPSRSRLPRRYRNVHLVLLEQRIRRPHPRYPGRYPRDDGFDGRDNRDRRIPITRASKKQKSRRSPVGSSQKPKPQNATVPPAPPAAQALQARAASPSPSRSAPTNPDYASRSAACPAPRA